MRLSDDMLNLLGVMIAAGAVCLSFATVFLARRQRRQDIFLRLQEILSDGDMQAGRYLLYESGRKGHLVFKNSSESGLVYRTVRMHNTVAIYVRRGLVPKAWVLDAWHHSLRSLKPGLMLYMAQEDGDSSWYVGTELLKLIEAAERFRSSMPCCRGKEADSRSDFSASGRDQMLDTAAGTTN